jgi:hypothetical protein
MILQYRSDSLQHRIQLLRHDLDRPGYGRQHDHGVVQTAQHPECVRDLAVEITFHLSNREWHTVMAAKVRNLQKLVVRISPIIPVKIYRPGVFAIENNQVT